MKAKGTKASMVGNATNAIGRNAGLRLKALFPGPHADKRIARTLGTSTAMAGYLKKGQHWTLDRLQQCWQLFGGEFIQTLFETPPPRGADPLNWHSLELSRRLQEFQLEINERLRVLEEGTHDAKRGRAGMPATDETRKAGAASAPLGTREVQAALASEPASSGEGSSASAKARRLGKDKRQT